MMEAVESVNAAEARRGPEESQAVPMTRRAETEPEPEVSSQGSKTFVSGDCDTVDVLSSPESSNYQKSSVSKRKKEKGDSGGEYRSFKFQKSDDNKSAATNNEEDDDDEKKKKKLMRQIRNRESAQLSRLRKKQRVEDLEGKVKSMSATIAELNGKISYVMAENAALRQQMATASGAPPMNMNPYMASPPLPYQWMPYPPYPVRGYGSQTPLVPIPKLNPKPVSSCRPKKAESKKNEGKSKLKKVASISFIGILFFIFLFGTLVPFMNVWYIGSELLPFCSQHRRAPSSAAAARFYCGGKIGHFGGDWFRPRGDGGGNVVQTLKPSNWKTRICNKWQITGYCPFGSNCHFAHGASAWNLQRIPYGDLIHVATPPEKTGLDPIIIQSFPVFLYSSTTTKNHGTECAICLSEFSDEDKVRLIPVCRHAFHSNCIDLWFELHKTCPVCRCELEPDLVGSGSNESLHNTITITIQDLYHEEEFPPPSTTGSSKRIVEASAWRFSRSHSTGHFMVKTTDVNVRIKKKHYQTGSCVSFDELTRYDEAGWLGDSSYINRIEV